MTLDRDLGLPLAKSEDSVPIVYPALGVELHLESLDPDDEARLDEANREIMTWIGGDLKWAVSSPFPLIEPFRPEDLDYASSYTKLLDTKLGEAPPGAQIPWLNFRASRVQDFFVHCHGGSEKSGASPTQYLFAATVADEPTIGDRFPTRSMLRVTVPTTWPLDDFRARVLELAGRLRVRWGAAGLMFAGFEPVWYSEVDAAVFAHARRHPGFDVGKHASFMNLWHASLRSVNWLTFVGPALLAKLAEEGVRLEPTDLVTILRTPGGAALQAGPRPEAGDMNRLNVPRAYIQADALLRPIRARAGIDFLGRWDEATTTEWLNRFERRTS